MPLFSREKFMKGKSRSSNFPGWLCKRPWPLKSSPNNPLNLKRAVLLIKCLVNIRAGLSILGRITKQWAGSFIYLLFYESGVTIKTVCLWTQPGLFWELHDDAVMEGQGVLSLCYNVREPGSELRYLGKWCGGPRAAGPAPWGLNPHYF